MSTCFQDRALARVTATRAVTVRSCWSSPRGTGVTTCRYGFDQASQALVDLADGGVQGPAVLVRQPDEAARP